MSEVMLNGLMPVSLAQNISERGIVLCFVENVAKNILKLFAFLASRNDFVMNA